MIKSRGPNGRASVTFTLPAAVGAEHPAICSEWNDWSAHRDVMEPTQGGFTHTVDLEAGRTYRFRYLLNGYRWENDWAADAYVPNDCGSDDSVVDLTALAEETPVASVEANAEAKPKRVVTKKATPAKKSAPTKKAEAGEAAKEVAPARKSVSARKTPRKPAG